MTYPITPPMATIIAYIIPTKSIILGGLLLAKFTQKTSKKLIKNLFVYKLNVNKNISTHSFTHCLFIWNSLVETELTLTFLRMLLVTDFIQEFLKKLKILIFNDVDLPLRCFLERLYLTIYS